MENLWITTPILKQFTLNFNNKKKLVTPERDAILKNLTQRSSS